MVESFAVRRVAFFSRPLSGQERSLDSLTEINLENAFTSTASAGRIRGDRNSTNFDVGLAGLDLGNTRLQSESICFGCLRRWAIRRCLRADARGYRWSLRRFPHPRCFRPNAAARLVPVAQKQKSCRTCSGRVGERLNFGQQRALPNLGFIQMEDHATLKAMLRRMAVLLAQDGRVEWGESLAKLSDRLDAEPDAAGRVVRGMYGGSGSLNDIVLHSGGVPCGSENDELDKLRSTVYKLVST